MTIVASSWFHNLHCQVVTSFGESVAKPKSAELSARDVQSACSQPSAGNQHHVAVPQNETAAAPFQENLSRAALCFSASQCEV